MLVESGQLPFNYLMVQHAIAEAIRLLETVKLVFDADDEPPQQSFPSIKRAISGFTLLCGDCFPDIALLKRLNPRPWNTNQVKIDWSVKAQFKVGESHIKARRIFQQLCHTKYVGWRHIYTDGSMDNGYVGFGIFAEGREVSFQLPSACSVFSAEAMAILYAVQNVIMDDVHTVIFSDSSSVLEAIENGQSKHPWIQQTEDKIADSNIRLCWIPGHVGIPGNETADKLARLGRNGNLLTTQLPGEDALRFCKNRLRENWENEWRISNNFLRIFKSSTTPWTDRKSPTEQRCLSRLRIGHTRLTHQHRFSKTSNMCDTCGEALTVRHILVDCRKYEIERQECNLDNSIEEILSYNKEREQKLVNFLRKSALLEKI